MKGIKRVTQSSYDVDDFIAIVKDDHVFGGRDLENGRAEEYLGNLTDSEINKLIMTDDQSGNMSVLMSVPTFRSLSSSNRNLKNLHRRKYKYSGSVVLKDNAQKKNG